MRAIHIKDMAEKFTQHFLQVPWAQRPWTATLTIPQASVHAWSGCNPSNTQYPIKHQQTSKTSTTEACLFSLLKTPSRTGIKPLKHGELLLQILIYTVIPAKEKACNTVKENRMGLSLKRLGLPKHFREFSKKILLLFCKVSLCTQGTDDTCIGLQFWRIRANNISV